MSDLAFRTARAAIAAHQEYADLVLYHLSAMALPWVLAAPGDYPAHLVARERPVTEGPAESPELSPLAASLRRQRDQVAKVLDDARAEALEIRRANQGLAEQLRAARREISALEGWRQTAATVAELLRPHFKEPVDHTNVVWAAEHVAELLDEAREVAKDARGEATVAAADAAALAEALRPLAALVDAVPPGWTDGASVFVPAGLLRAAERALAAPATARLSAMVAVWRERGHLAGLLDEAAS